MVLFVADRLSKADWVRHGLEILARDGVSSIKADRMARDLNVSRGSFYWHFADISAFHWALLDAWEETTTTQVIEETDPAAGITALRELIERSLADERRLDRAVRAWAVQSEEAAVRVAKVDARRVDHIRALLGSCGLEPNPAEQRSQFLYWSYLGRVDAVIKQGEREELAQALTQMLIAKVFVTTEA